MLEVVDRFATTTERRIILQGLLGYRAALRDAGITAGFQWLDGSFTEDKESLRGEAPNDIDVITLFPLPPGEGEAVLKDRAGHLFNGETMKPRFKVHPVALVLRAPMVAADVRRLVYWHGVWSHRRDGLWKGFVEVDLDGGRDVEAADLLATLEREGATP